LIGALACAHERGVLHGDLKPSKRDAGPRTGLRLFDFGLGQPVKGLLNGLPKLSRKRIAAWTPRYAALELLNGEGLTSTADVVRACVHIVRNLPAACTPIAD